MNSISLKEIPYNWEDEDSINWVGMGTERCFEIILNETYTIGLLFISEDTETASGLPCKTYVTWLEFVSIYRKKHLLKPTMNAIYNMFGEFHFESSEDHQKKYHHIGATSLGIDDLTENEIFKYSAA